MQSTRAPLVSWCRTVGKYAGVAGQPLPHQRTQYGSLPLAPATSVDDTYTALTAVVLSFKKRQQDVSRLLTAQAMEVEFRSGRKASCTQTAHDRVLHTGALQGFRGRSSGFETGREFRLGRHYTASPVRIGCLRVRVLSGGGRGRRGIGTVGRADWTTVGHRLAKEAPFLVSDRGVAASAHGVSALLAGCARIRRIQCR